MKDNTILIILAILLVLILYYKPIKEPFGMEVKYYKDGVEISPYSLFAIVKGDYDEIAFNIYGSETEGYPINDLMIEDATPQAFKDALPTTTQTLGAYETDKLLWTSGKIPTAQFVDYPQPTTFWVKISGAGTSRESSVDLEITKTPEIISCDFTAESRPDGWVIEREHDVFPDVDYSIWDATNNEEDLHIGTDNSVFLRYDTVVPTGVYEVGFRNIIINTPTSMRLYLYVKPHWIYLERIGSAVYVGDRIIAERNPFGDGVVPDTLWLRITLKGNGEYKSEYGTTRLSYDTLSVSSGAAEIIEKPKAGFESPGEGGVGSCSIHSFEMTI